MALSEDTVALVAAQLTAAWAIREGAVQKPSSGFAPTADQTNIIMAQYSRFTAQVRGAPDRGVR